MKNEKLCQVEFSLGDTTTCGLQLILSKTTRIDHTKYQRERERERVVLCGMATPILLIQRNCQLTNVENWGQLFRCVKQRGEFTSKKRTAKCLRYGYLSTIIQQFRVVSDTKYTTQNMIFSVSLYLALLPPHHVQR